MRLLAIQVDYPQGVLVVLLVSLVDCPGGVVVVLLASLVDYPQEAVVVLLASPVEYSQAGGVQEVQEVLMKVLKFQEELAEHSLH